MVHESGVRHLPEGPERAGLGRVAGTPRPRVRVRVVEGGEEVTEVEADTVARRPRPLWPSHVEVPRRVDGRPAEGTEGTAVPVDPVPDPCVGHTSIRSPTGSRGVSRTPERGSGTKETHRPEPRPPTRSEGDGPSYSDRSRLTSGNHFPRTLNVGPES